MKNNADKQKELVDFMLDKFLSWPLPKNFSPDCGISFKEIDFPGMWPTGTNLFDAQQAREMIMHMLSDFCVYEAIFKPELLNGVKP